MGYYWETQFAEQLRETPSRKKALLSLLRKEQSAWEDRGLVQDPTYGEKVLAQYEQVLEDLETELFAEPELSTNVRERLKGTVRELYTRAWPEPWEGGLVVAGMGELEPFPLIIATGVAYRANAHDRAAGPCVVGLDNCRRQGHSLEVHRQEANNKCLFASLIGRLQDIDRSQMFFSGGTCWEQYEHQKNPSIPFDTQQFFNPLNCPLGGPHQQ